MAAARSRLSTTLDLQKGPQMFPGPLGANLGLTRPAEIQPSRQVEGDRKLLRVHYFELIRKIS